MGLIMFVVEGGWLTEHFMHGTASIYGCCLGTVILRRNEKLVGVGKERFVGSLGGGGEGIEEFGFGGPSLPLRIRGTLWGRGRGVIFSVRLRRNVFVFLREGNGLRLGESCGN